MVLREHPLIYMPRAPRWYRAWRNALTTTPRLREVWHYKDLDFFGNPARYHTLGLDGYGRYFARVRGERLIGEAGVGYLPCVTIPSWGKVSAFHAATPDRIAHDLGMHIKVIAVLRNPIDRAVSAFLHHRRRKRFPTDARLAAYWHERGIMHTGFYATHLARWRAVFPPQQFFVVTSEEMFASPTAVRRMLEFLGAPPAFAPDWLNRGVGTGTGFIRSEAGVMDHQGRLIANAGVVARLREIYREDVERLGRAWPLDLSAWAVDFPAVCSVSTATGTSSSAERRRAAPSINTPDDRSDGYH